MPAIVTLTMNPALDVATATEIIVPSTKLRCEEPRYDPGGGGINVARAVHMLGGDALAVYPVGGATGEMIRGFLEAEGVPQAVVPVASMTRQSLAVVERQSGKQYRFLLPGPPLGAHDRERCLDALAAQAKGAVFIVASGSLPPGAPEDFYARLARIVGARHSRMVLDASGQALAAALEEGVYLVKPNLRELRQLTGQPLEGEEEWAAAATRLATSGKAQVVALSLGHPGKDRQHGRRRRQLSRRDGLAPRVRQWSRGRVPVRRCGRHGGAARAGHQPRAQG